MNGFSQILIVSITSIIFIVILLFALWVHIRIANELKFKNEFLEIKLNYYKKLNESLKYELKFQKTVTQTFSDGLEALTKKQK